mmetsp:Transcript_63007/g.95091  ORF Transcript_63007/g.95091 Transcript_63007/m.95091 type:complete len:263 (-) Transcript_63007:234-1022(-)
MTELLSSRSEHKSATATTLRLPHRSPHIPEARKANSLRKDGKVKATASQRRRVAFSRDVQTENVILRSEISKDEFEATWYCHHEFRSMKKSMIPTIKKMAKGIPLDDNEEPRGLEHKTPQGCKKRCDNRFISLDAVLQEQDRQWEYDRNDVAALAKVYNQASAHCLMQAFLKAKEDADYVLREVRSEISSEKANEEKQDAEDVLQGVASDVTSNEAKENIIVSKDTIVEKARAVSSTSRVIPTRACERLAGFQSARVLSAAA